MSPPVPVQWSDHTPVPNRQSSEGMGLPPPLWKQSVSPLQSNPDKAGRCPSVTGWQLCGKHCTGKHSGLDCYRIEVRAVEAPFDGLEHAICIAFDI